MARKLRSPQMYSQNSFRPALAKQSIPRTVTVAPLNEIDRTEVQNPTAAICRIRTVKYKPKMAKLKMRMKTLLPVKEGIREPSLQTSSHMLKQKPPRRQHDPCKTSWKKAVTTAMITPDTTIATKNPPCFASLTGTCAQYTIKAWSYLACNYNGGIKQLTEQAKQPKKKKENVTFTLPLSICVYVRPIIYPLTVSFCYLEWYMQFQILS